VHVMEITSSLRNYSVDFPQSPDFFSRLLSRFPNHFTIIDENVWRLYGGTLLSAVDLERAAVLPVEEERKSLESVLLLYDRLVRQTAKRNITVISVGGGILQDISGFAASTIYRGVNWVYVPTTLLAQADSCIGGKTSLNYGPYKNLIGTFYPPAEVLVHTAFLQTLQDLDFYSGLGEVVKLAIIGGDEATGEMVRLLPRMLERQERALHQGVHRSLLIKSRYITEDEFDSGIRNFLNYGHCFGHALESTTEFAVPHGQAIVVGMLLANIVGRRRNLLSSDLFDFLTQKLILPSIKVRLRPEQMAVGPVVGAMKQDKKRTGKDLPLVMLMDAFKMAKVDDLKESEAADALAEGMDILGSAGGVTT
jgi:3-dehydroquinate synthase